MRIGITSGCFDILHPLHVLFLEKCARECDELLVLVDSDELIKETKGKLPVFNEQDRVILLHALESVGHAMIFNSMDEYRLYIKDALASKDRKDSVTVFKNRSTFPNSSVKDVIDIPGVMIRYIEDVKRFSSSTEIKQFHQL